MVPRINDWAGRPTNQPGTFVRWLLHASLILAAGCGGAKVVHVESAPTFDYSQAASGDVGIAGFTSRLADSAQREALERNLPPLLAQSLQTRWPDIHILSPERIREALGPEIYRVMFDSYAELGTLDRVDLEELSNSLQDVVQYVVVGRIDLDEVSYDRQESEDSTRTVETYKTKRDIQVTLEVYDLVQDSVVFTTTITNSVTKSRDETSPKQTEGESFLGNCMESCFTGIIDNLLGDKTEGNSYPVPAADDEMTKDVFDKFAESLPEPESA